VRFPGGSGAFVSGQGLLLTNHHIARGCVSALSSPAHDYMNEGFVAATRAAERPCPGLQVSELMAIERVTARVRGVERPGQSPAEAEAARRKEMAAIEKECVSKTALRCDVVTLYSGREYDLYQAKRFTDVRLAFAPATQLAQFGGDTDNFEFPRWSADFALLRAYVDGKPATTEHFLAWSHTGVRDGDFVAISGHPGSTGRRLTLAQREYLRDVRYPLSLLYLNATRDAMVRFGARGAEPKRIARDDLRSVENALKATGGYLSGLLDRAALDRAATDERHLRAGVAKDEALAARVGDPWSEIERALAVRRTLYPRQAALAAVPAAGKLAGWARTLVRLAHERAKPSGERWREFRDTALPELLADLVAAVPVYAEYEEATLAPALRLLRSELGPLHPVVRAAFGDRTPEQLAHEAVAGTALADAAERTRLSTVDGAALDASTDPMIRLLGALEPLAMEVRRRTEDEADAVEDPASARVADAYFGVYGTSVYPDATGTLRLSYGKVAGLRDGGARDPLRVAPGRLLRALDGARQRAAVRPSAGPHRGARPAGARHAARRCDRPRHHRRQLRQPDGRSCGRARGGDLRRQPLGPAQPLRLRRRAGAGGGRRRPRDPRGAAQGLSGATPRRRAHRRNGQVTSGAVAGQSLGRASQLPAKALAGPVTSRPKPWPAWPPQPSRARTV
jgi:hypothetical protein